MTVLEDRIEMADQNTKDLDAWFERLERMPVPEGYKVEIVGGNVHMTPQRDTHWEIIFEIAHALRTKFGRRPKVLSDVRIDFPGRLNGFCPDIAMFKESAKKDDKGRWRHEDVDFIAEVISEGTAPNDYGPKKLAYAEAEIPVYLVADPYQGRCYVYTDPKDGDYEERKPVDFGTDVDLTGTVVDLTLKTDGFPRD